MKCYRLELVGFDDRELRRELYALAEDCQQIVNRIWQVWECWHVANDSRSAIVAYLAAREAGEKPAWPVECFPVLAGKQANRAGNPRNLRNEIWDDLAAKFPHVHARLRVLLVNDTCKKISQTKAARGSLRGWSAILLNRQSRPSSTRVLPIPFDRANSKIVPGDKDATLYVRLFRDPEAGRKVSDFTAFTLRTSGRAARYVKPIVRMATGEWAFKGSDLFYDDRKKKWFALLACETGPAPQVAAVAGSRAVLRCGFAHPIQLRVAGRRRFLRNFRSGTAVAEVRRRLLTQRWSRQDNYRVAGSANKGHGRNRALGPIFLLSRRWKDFVKRFNHTLTSQLVGLCLAEGVGELHYFQPDGGRFLDRAGKQPGRTDGTGWDYFQIKTLLDYKCGQHGIAFVVHAPDRKRLGVTSSAR